MKTIESILSQLTDISIVEDLQKNPPGEGSGVPARGGKIPGSPA